MQRPRVHGVFLENYTDQDPVRNPAALICQQEQACRTSDTLEDNGGPTSGPPNAGSCVLGFRLGTWGSQQGGFVTKSLTRGKLPSTVSDARGDQRGTPATFRLNGGITCTA